MPFIADLHMHSKYSRACSKNLDLPHTHAWGQMKGVDLLTVADFTHPTWFKTISEQLREVAEGIYELKEEFRLDGSAALRDGALSGEAGGNGEDAWGNKALVQVPEKCQRPLKYLLTTEISLIYKHNDKVRKVHHVILAPNLATVAKINIELGKRGNLHSDGRPILGLTSKDFLKILLDISPDIQLIPAHIWTPHFAVLGSKSGYDSVEECFEELASHICALETGLSSDPAMNWRLSQLDKYVLVSNSDAHSPQKMGREATIFDCEMSYPAILDVLRNHHEKVAGTIEFFPEEGKYHCDGLREEKLCWEPEETRRHQGLSPKSGKPVTVGVLNRVTGLADREKGARPKSARPFWNIIPLPEIIAEICGVGVASNRVQQRFFETLSALGPEFHILKEAKIREIALFDETLAEAIDRMRKGKVNLRPGYDGEFGVIKVFATGDGNKRKDQMAMF